MERLLRTPDLKQRLDGLLIELRVADAKAQAAAGAASETEPQPFECVNRAPAVVRGFGGPAPLLIEQGQPAVGDGQALVRPRPSIHHLDRLAVPVFRFVEPPVALRQLSAEAVR